MTDNYNVLYDEVHAIMTKEILSFFKKYVENIESEVSYNYYGNRGNVDLVWYDSMKILGITHRILRMFELESRIVRLEELIRKLKDRMEYFPRYFEQTKGLPKLGEVHLSLVLLNTKENWQVVNDYLVNFKSAFSSLNKIFSNDILSKTKNPSDDNFYAQKKRVHLVFSDPLKVRQIEINEDHINNESLPFYRISAFQYLEAWYDSMEKLQHQLKSIKIRFSDAREFLDAYKRYISS